MSTRASTYDERGSGWLVFAGTMLALVGTLNVIGGISAISNSKFWVHGEKYAVGSLKTWGWILLITGALQLLTAFGVWAGNRAAAWAGILVAAVNGFANLMDIPSYPLWAITMFGVDILIVYGLAVYGTTRDT